MVRRSITGDSDGDQLFYEIAERVYTRFYYSTGDPRRAVEVAIKLAEYFVKKWAKKEKRLTKLKKALLPSNPSTRIYKVKPTQAYEVEQAIYLEIQQYRRVWLASWWAKQITIDKETIAVWIIEHLLHVAMTHNSTYVAVAVLKILCDYSYEDISSAHFLINSENSPHTDVLRRRKSTLFDNVAEKFEDFVETVSISPTEGKRFVTQDPPVISSEAVKTLLKLITPPQPECCEIPEGFEPDSFDFVEHVKQDVGAASENSLEWKRVHTMIHPKCFSRILSALKLKDWISQLRILKIILPPGGGDESQPPSDRRQLCRFGEDERRMIQDTRLGREGIYRGSEPLKSVKLVYGDEEPIQFFLDKQNKLELNLKLGDTAVEVAYPDQADFLPLDLFVLSWNKRSKRRQTFTTSLPGGGKVRLVVKFIRDEFGEPVRAELAVNYIEPFETIKKAVVAAALVLGGVALFGKYVRRHKALATSTAGVMGAIITAISFLSSMAPLNSLEAINVGAFDLPSFPYAVAKVEPTPALPYPKKPTRKNNFIIEKEVTQSGQGGYISTAIDRTPIEPDSSRLSLITKREDFLSTPKKFGSPEDVLARSFDLLYRTNDFNSLAAAPLKLRSFEYMRLQLDWVGVQRRDARNNQAYRTLLFADGRNLLPVDAYNQLQMLRLNEAASSFNGPKLDDLYDLTRAARNELFPTWEARAGFPLITNTDFPFITNNRIDLYLKKPPIGNVTTPDGAVVSQAKLTLVDSASGEMLSTIYSDDNGKFILPELKPGQYKLFVEKKEYEKKTVVLTGTDQDSVTLNIKLDKAENSYPAAVAERLPEPANTSSSGSYLYQTRSRAVYASDRTSFMPARSRSPEANSKNLSSYTFVLKRGQIICVSLDSEISSEYSRVGDTFSTSVTQPIYVGERPVIPIGTKIIGRVANVKRAGQSESPGILDVEFTSLRFPNGAASKIRGELADSRSNAQPPPDKYKVVLQGGTSEAPGTRLALISATIFNKDTDASASGQSRADFSSKAEAAVAEPGKRLCISLRDKRTITPFR